MTMDSQTRATLLQRLREPGAAMAWEEFFQRYWRLIFASARSRGCSDHTAEEVVQEVMLTVFEKRDAFRYDPARGRFRDWLGRVTRNVVARHRRQPSARIRPKGGDRQAALTSRESAEEPPDEAWQAAFDAATLAVLLEVVRRDVAPETFQAFELVTLHELPGAEVAAVTGLSRNAVYLARKRVMRRLRDLGAPYREDGRLHRRVKEALQALPAAAVERSVTTRVEKTMRSARRAIDR